MKLVCLMIRYRLFENSDFASSDEIGSNHHLRRKTTENGMDNVIFLTVDLTLLKPQTFSMLIVFHVIAKRTECVNRPLYLVRFLFLIRTM